MKQLEMFDLYEEEFKRLRYESKICRINTFILRRSIEKVTKYEPCTENLDKLKEKFKFKLTLRKMKPTLLILLMPLFFMGQPTSTVTMTLPTFEEWKLYHPDPLPSKEERKLDSLILEIKELKKCIKELKEMLWTHGNYTADKLEEIDMHIIYYTKPK